MREEHTNPYASEAQRGPEDCTGVAAGHDRERTPMGRAVRTMLLAVALMCAVVVAMSAILFIESVVNEQTIESFWAELADESWVPMLFVGTLPVVLGGRKDGCCCVSRLLRRRSARAAARMPAAEQTPTG